MLDRTFHFIITCIVQTGKAPHYTDIAAAMGVSPEQGRQVLHDLMKTGYSGWLHPGTDYIVSFPPFSIFPTQYRVEVEGHEKWYAQ
jgi:hypothetical protein